MTEPGKQPKKNMWMLALSFALCVGWIFADSLELAIPPVFTAIVLLAAILLMSGYVISNYRKRNR